MSVDSTSGGTVTVSQGVLAKLDALLTDLPDEKALKMRIKPQSQADDIVDERADLKPL